jgi:Tfp pilus assembly protein PilX
MSLVISMMALTLLTALGGALVLGTVAETAIAASYREGAETFYAAEAAVEFAMQELAVAPDWEEIAAGDRTSSFVDGPPAGIRRVGAATLDLTTATEDVATAAADVDGEVSYHLYAYGRFAELIPAAARSPYYVMAWTAGLEAGDAGGWPIMRIVGRAYGPTGSRRSIVVSVTRPPDSGETPQVLSWYELR